MPSILIGMEYLLYFFLALWAFNFLSTLAGAWLALRHHRAAPNEVKRVAIWPAVSILKPLKGIDTDLEGNLESFFRLDYPIYEILFSATDPLDPACAIAHRLIAAHPEIPAKLVVGGVEAGPNPKVNNLLRPYAHATYDLVLIADSNVRAERSYLKALVSRLQADVGIVTGVAAGRSAMNVAGEVEAAYLNTFFARWMHLASALGVPLVMGKSMLFRRSVAERFGGLGALSGYLAEDYWMGVKMQGLGLKVTMMRNPIRQHLGRYGLGAYWSRHVRWGRIRKAQAPLAFLLEPIGTVSLSSLCAALAIPHCFGPHWVGLSPIACGLLNAAIVSASDLVMLERVGDGIRPRALLGWLLREALALPLWAHTLLGNTVSWRGTRLRLLPGGRVSPLAGTPPLPSVIEVPDDVPGLPLPLQNAR